MEMTKGEQFTKAITSLHHIGPRTRRYRDNRDLIRAMLDDVREATAHPFMFSEQRTKALQSGYTAVNAYSKHIEGCRIAPEKVLAVKSLNPYQFAKFLGRMIDAEISNMYEAELWLADAEV